MRKNASIYRFPSNKRAEMLSLTDQVSYIEGELREVKQAILLCEGDMRVIEELWDVAQTIEGALRKFPIHKVVFGFFLVLFKSRRRGDYGKES